MVESIRNNSTAYDSNLSNFAIGTLGTVAAWEAQPYIQKGLMYPARKYVIKGINEISCSGLEPYIKKAITQNGLDNSFKIINLNAQTANTVKKQLGWNFNKKIPTAQKIINHILRLPTKHAEESFNATIQGKQAFFSPKNNAVVCNFDKFGSPVFHEIQHKLNSVSKNPIIKTLSKIRNPLAFIGPLAISAIAMFTDSPKDEREEKTISGFIKKHCGALTFLSLLPKTAEEFIANIKGTEIAKKAGVTGQMLDKIKKTHKISMVSYASGAICASLAVVLASKLRDYICSHRKPKTQVAAKIKQVQTTPKTGRTKPVIA